MHWYQLLLFSVYIITVIYIVNCLIARQIKRVHFREAAVYITTMAMLGVFGEVFVGSVYHALFGHALWLYRVAPVHLGYTSYYAPFIWGALGFHIYLLHNYLKARNVEATLHLALIFSLETILLEILGNGSFKLFFGHYLFYYLPGDLWHLTSLQTLPFYFPAGIIMVKAVRHFKTDPRFYSIMCLLLAFTLVYLAK